MLSCSRQHCVTRVLHTRVHPLPACGTVNVGGIPSEEHPPGPVVRHLTFVDAKRGEPNRVGRAYSTGKALVKNGLRCSTTNTTKPNSRARTWMSISLVSTARSRNLTSGALRQSTRADPPRTLSSRRYVAHPPGRIYRPLGEGRRVESGHRLPQPHRSKLIARVTLTTIGIKCTTKQ